MEEVELSVILPITPSSLTGVRTPKVGDTHRRVSGLGGNCSLLPYRSTRFVKRVHATRKTRLGRTASSVAGLLPQRPSLGTQRPAYQLLPAGAGPLAQPGISPYPHDLAMSLASNSDYSGCCRVSQPLGPTVARMVEVDDFPTHPFRYEGT